MCWTSLPVLKELNQNHGVKSEEVERSKSLILENEEKQLSLLKVEVKIESNNDTRDT